MIISKNKSQKTEDRSWKTDYFCPLFSVLCFLSSVFCPLFSVISAQDFPIPDAPAQREAGAQVQDEKINLDLKGVDINELFKLLTSKSGFTIITTPAVQGRITVFLNNLDFEDALDVILTIQGLACEKSDKVIKVMTAQEYEKIFGRKYGEKKKVKTIKLQFAKPANISNIISSLKSEAGKIIVDEPSGTLLIIDIPETIALMEETIKQLDVPLETAVFDINYANSADIKTYLSDLITPGVGQLIIDPRSSKAVVSDLPTRLVKIKRLMNEFDEASRQVLITGEIVQVSLSDKFKRGIEWEKLFSESLNDTDLVGNFSAFPSTATTLGKLNVGTLSRDHFSIILKLLEEYGKVDILSRPQVVVVNKEEAKILVGSREVYVTSTQSQSETTITAESVEFIDVGIKLRVVPTIGKDGFITMKVKPEVSSVRTTFETTGGSKIPVVDTSETETVVKVKDGAMIMISGLIKRENKDEIDGLPHLSKRPILGWLFGTRTKEDNRTETVIFLTPKLISGDVKPSPVGDEKIGKF